MSYTRQAAHAGSWYRNSKGGLSSDVNGFLEAAKKSSSSNLDVEVDSSTSSNRNLKPLKCIISPHAGLSYSGPTAGHCYQAIQPEKYKTIFLLGPSHKFYLNNFALSNASSYETPLGNLNLNNEIISNLAETSKKGVFSFLQKKSDENEHSLEMQLPFLAKMFENYLDEIKIVPILVGDFNKNKNISVEEFANSLVPYFKREDCLFVVSSDFCHWGERFGFTRYYEKGYGDESLSFPGDIYRGIEAMDRHGMDVIASGENAYSQFNNYLKNTNNTICGRNPILLLLKLIESSKSSTTIQFLKYDQSSSVKSNRDSSVSYAAAVGY